MDIHILSDVEGAKKAKGIVVVIDILRAATVASYLLDKGIVSITPVATQEEAFRMRKRDGTLLLVGENNGVKIEGFDISNSPFEIKRMPKLEGKHAVHRSTTGTQGLVNVKNADQVIFGSFVSHSALLRYILEADPKIVSLVSMGGLEDEMYANFLKKSLMKQDTDKIEAIVSGLEVHPGCQWFLDPSKPDFPKEDFYLCLEVDVFNFFPILTDGKIVKHF